VWSFAEDVTALGLNMMPLNASSRNHAGIEWKINDNKINELSFSLGSVEVRIGKKSELAAAGRQFLDFCQVFLQVNGSYFHYIISHL
jgi:hypothetical protein